NPFNPNTTISYELRITSYVEVKIYNIEGKELKTLVSRNQNSGTHKIEFDGNGISSGVYFYSLFIDGNLADTKKMLLIR
ncbi:MAG: T9SS type A sorting domain-containing protein, partial [Ignavibacteria bacterium]